MILTENALILLGTVSLLSLILTVFFVGRMFISSHSAWVKALYDKAFKGGAD